MDRASLPQNLQHRCRRHVRLVSGHLGRSRRRRSRQRSQQHLWGEPHPEQQRIQRGCRLCVHPPTPFHPPSGPAPRLAQGPPSKSKFLATTPPLMVHRRKHAIPKAPQRPHYPEITPPPVIGSSAEIVNNAKPPNPPTSTSGPMAIQPPPAPPPSKPGPTDSCSSRPEATP